MPVTTIHPAPITPAVATPVRIATAKPLTETQANAVWTLLVRELGAMEREREVFCEYVTRPTAHGHEYRFGGVLGTGGKFYNETGGWRVSCYLEGRTAKRNRLITAVNDRLAVMRQPRQQHRMPTPGSAEWAALNPHQAGPGTMAVTAGDADDPGMDGETTRGFGESQ